MVASHIKPWSVSTNDERLDGDNGLLLSATYDKLFDSGLITFNEDGKISVSNVISESDLEILNINFDKAYDIRFNDNMRKYLEYHRGFIFAGRSD